MGKVFGVGTNDRSIKVSSGRVRSFEYTTWCNMLKRCYSEVNLKVDTSYEDKYVCGEWLHFPTFHNWCQQVEYKEKGWHLDKDLLVKGNKEYGPDTCVFIPPRINGLILKCDSHRGDLPIGVHFDKSRLKYKATCQNEFDKQSQKRFFTIEETFRWYKQEKERVIKVVADRYKDVIDPRAYKALINYTVEITD